MPHADRTPTRAADDGSPPGGSHGPGDDASVSGGATGTGAGRRRPFWRELPVLVLVALAVALLLKTFLVQAFSIPSGSMEPTLMPGDRVLVDKLADGFGDVGRGDVIVFRNPAFVTPGRSPIAAFGRWLGESFGIAQANDEYLIKRVIGLPGDRVEIRNRRVYVNGRPLREPYLTTAARRSMTDYGPVRVPPDRLFVLGDNRGHSGDSRVIGFIPQAQVVGRAFLVVWPPSDAGGLGALG